MGVTEAHSWKILNKKTFSVIHYFLILNTQENSMSLPVSTIFPTNRL